MGFFDIFRAKEKPQNARRGFQAARIDRLTASWLATSRSINDELRGDLDKLRARSRDLARNNDYMRKFSRMVARNVVGPNGFTLYGRVEDAPGKPDTLANKAIEEAFWRWSRRGSCEITGRMSFADVQQSVIKSVAIDGEALVMKVRGKDARNPEQFALQLLDVGRLDTQRNQAPANGRNAIVMGVEIDKYQRPLAYWIKAKPDSQISERVPAADILHIFVPEDAEQIRGLPWGHAAILALHDLGEFNKAALLAARKGAETLGFIVSPDGDPSAMADDDEEGEPIKISAPGTYDVLPDGYDIRTPDLNYPHAFYGDFTKTILRRISSGLDVAYNSLGNDLEGVNFSSIRAGVLEEREQWLTLQRWFADAFLEEVFSEWFIRAMTAGTLVMPNGSQLPVAKAEKFRAHEWQGRRWKWVDPLKDITAAREAIKLGIESPQSVAAQNGVDVEDVLDAIAAFEAMASAKGVSIIDYGPRQPFADIAAE